MSENINVTISELEPINVTIQGYSFVEDIESTLNSYIIQETPTLVGGTTATYECANKFYDSQLKVWVNGLKENSGGITKDGDNKRFTLASAIRITAMIECEYIKKST